jgi:hypothetical protein
MIPETVLIVILAFFFFVSITDGISSNISSKSLISKAIYESKQVKNDLDYYFIKSPW